MHGLIVIVFFTMILSGLCLILLVSLVSLLCSSSAKPSISLDSDDATSSSSSNIAANQVNVNAELMKTMRFLTTGWVALPQLLPEMQSPMFRDRVLIAEAKARLAYVNFSYDRLRNIDARLDVQGICGTTTSTSSASGLHTISAASLDLRKGQAESDARDIAQRTAAAEVRRLRECSAAAQQRSEGMGLGHSAEAFQLPYMQSINVHRLDDKIYALATSRKLGRLAAMLLQEPAVSLYQTTVFLMGEGSGFSDATSSGSTSTSSASGGNNRGTNWHRDLNMVPLGKSMSIVYIILILCLYKNLL